jgi:hypothetical protein
MEPPIYPNRYWNKPEHPRDYIPYLFQWVANADTLNNTQLDELFECLMTAVDDIYVSDGDKCSVYEHAIKRSSDNRLLARLLDENRCDINEIIVKKPSWAWIGNSKAIAMTLFERAILSCSWKRANIFLKYGADPDNVINPDDPYYKQCLSEFPRESWTKSATKV